MSEKVTIYDLEIDEERFERIQDRIEELDPSRNYGKKHVGRKAFQLLDYLLEEELKEAGKSVAQVERRINDLKEVVEE